MDVTVTTPLEMNVGQQKYVVAYTLKQGTESKQPDILSAQKSDNIDSVQKLGSPAAIRPDALFSSSSPSSSTHKNSSSNHHHHHHSGKSSEHQVTSSSSPPLSHHGTLKYNDNKGYMALNQTIAGNYNAQPPPYCSAMMNDFETPLNYATVNYNNNSTSGTSSNSISNASYHQLHHHQPQQQHQQPFPEYNNLNNLFSGGNATNALPNLSNELLESSSDGFLTSSSTTSTAAAAAAHLDNNKMRYDDGLRDYKFANGPSPNASYHHDYHVNGESSSMPSAGSPNVVDYKNLANQIASTISNINSTLSRSRNRNHILTDNLPGPESCV
jgi:hypothetical protein